MSTFDHIVLTRFNMREDIDNPVIPDEDWHEKRFSLFEQYCYPSVKSQINNNFKWLVFFDTLTPKRFLDRIESYKNLPNFIPIFSDDLSFFRKHIKNYIQNEAEYLITSRLDNDDAISNDFIENIQRQFNCQEFEFINFYDGYILYKDKLYKHKDKSNAFLSLIEKTTDEPYKTVWCVMHHKAAVIGNITQINNTPAWLQIIHATNVSNRIKGIRTKNYDTIEKKFAVNFQGNNGFINYYFDLLCFCPLRTIREGLIKLLKKTVDDSLINHIKNLIFRKK